MKFYDFYNSKLKEVMRNLTCAVGVYQILLLVIRFVLTRVETDFSWTCFSRCGGGVGGGGGILEAVETGYTFLVDCCWEIQMRKNGVTIKRRNSL